MPNQKHRYHMVYGSSPPPSKAVVCQRNMTASYRDSTLIRPPYIGIPPCADHLISVYRLTQTALFRDTTLLQAALYRDTTSFRPPYIGIPPYSDHLNIKMPPYSDRGISEYHPTRTALYRNTTSLRPNHWGTATVYQVLGDPGARNQTYPPVNHHHININIIT